MNIDVILTGGTIGTVLINNQATLDNTLLLKKLVDNDKHNFTFHNPYNIHSENLLQIHWQKLFNQIKEIKNTDGIIVMHGTDTLVFTAAFLSLAFGKSDIPIVLVSAHSPIESPTSNAIDNFQMAVSAIENKVKGVFVSYRNCNSPKTLYLANKLLNFAPYNNNLISTKEPHAKIIDNKFALCGEHFCEDHLPEIVFPLNKVIYIPAAPFTDFSFYLNCKNQPDCYLVELYHSTTCCISAEEYKYSFSYFVDRCNEKNIKVFIAPYENREYYYPSKEYFSKAFPLLGDTIVVAYTRLLFKNLL